MNESHFWSGSKPKKPKYKTPPPAKKRVRNFTYEEARTLVQDECIESSTSYEKWWKLHRPCKMPKNPENAYKKVWKGWGDFLGVHNDYPFVHKKVRSYEDCRMFAHRLKLRSRDEWKQYCKSGNKPDDIPSRPDVKYQKNGEWNGWKSFLGYTVVDRIETLRKLVDIFFILQDRSFPSNVYKIGTLKGSKADILDICQNTGLNLVGAYYLPPHLDVKGLLARNCQPYMYGSGNDYSVYNIHDLMYHMDCDCERINFTASSIT